MSADNNYKEVDNQKELSRYFREIEKTKPSAQFQFYKPPDFHQCMITYWAQKEGYFFVQYIGPERSERISSSNALSAHIDEYGFFNIFLFTSQVIFKAKLMKIDQVKGLQFSFPEKFYKVQRRKHLRVPLPENAKAEAVLTLINQEGKAAIKITRQILDLSIGGLAVKLLKEDAEVIKAHPRLHMIDINVGDITMTNPGVIRNQTPVKLGIEMDLTNQIQQKKFAAFLVQQLRAILDDPTVEYL